MWKTLIKLVEKWACCHEWESHFPDECNIWARENYEAQAIECACIEIIYQQ